MLQELIIDNLALLKHIQLSFGNGMTCLTGETGAGKSILLDALGFTMGNKIESSLINQNKPASVTTIYNITYIINDKNNNIINWLVNNNFLDLEQILSKLEKKHSKTINITIHINRLITKDSIKNNTKSKNTINNISASLKQLKQLGELLIYIHGQHEHLNLLKEQNQLKILDSFAKTTFLNQDVNNIYKQYIDTEKLLAHKLQLKNDYEAKKQLLEFKLEELENAHLKPNEWQEINEQHTWLANQEYYIKQLQQVDFIIDEGDDSQPSLNQQLNYILNILSEINQNNNLANISEYVSSALIQISEAKTEIKNFLSSLDTDPETLNKLDKRISELHDLSRKYKTTPQNLIELYNNYKLELSSFNQSDTDIKELKNKLTALKQEYNNLADILTDKRKQAAEKLSHELTNLLKKLQMPKSELSIKLKSFNSEHPTLNGHESCAFMIKTNTGQDMQTLADCTSGGELSRVALATQVIKAQVEGAPSLIFDEVDVGIGGGTAEIVGKLLRKMGNDTQVMCITHLAQVAAQADHHLKVIKTEKNKETMTQVELLSQTKRVAEIARMIGGLTITKQTLAHAEELLSHAQI